MSLPRNSYSAVDAVAEMVCDLRTSAARIYSFTSKPDVCITNVQDGKRSYTAKLVLSSPQRRKELLIKIVRRGATQADAQAFAANEYRVLKLAEAQFAAERRLSTPKPVQLFEEHAAYVMEFVSGRPLTQVISHTLRGFLTSHGFEQCLAVITDCAQWLKLFHMLPAGDMSATELFTNQISSLYTRLNHAQARQLLDLDTVARLTERFASECQYGANQPIGLAHHDFGPHNILITHNGICVLDLGDAQPQCILHDIARFSLEIEILATGWCFFNRRTQYRQLSDAFLSSFGVTPQDPRLEPFTVNSALALLLTALPKGPSSRGVRSWHRHLGQYLVERLKHAA